MYVIQFALYRSSEYPLLGNALYERLAGIYKLPSIETLLKSLNEPVTWPNDVEAYYMDNLQEANRRHLFQVRFHTSLKSGDFTSIFLSMEESTIHTTTVIFPPRGDRGCSSKILAELKSIARETNAQDIPLTVEGFMEMGQVRFIRESKLSAFVWIDGLNRYLHISENPQMVKEVKGNLTHL